MIGSGYLVLKSGVKSQVGWQIDLSDGRIRGGSIQGDAGHLTTAVNDRCATLELTACITLAIAIEQSNDNGVTFLTLLTSKTPSEFHAQNICGSKPLSESTFLIELSDAEGETLIVTVPTLLLRDYLPVLHEQVPSNPPTAPRTGFFRVPRKWDTGTARSHPYVLLSFGDDEPLGLDPDEARLLAEELNENAEKVASRTPTRQ